MPPSPSRPGRSSSSYFPAVVRISVTGREGPCETSESSARVLFRKAALTGAVADNRQTRQRRGGRPLGGAILIMFRYYFKPKRTKETNKLNVCNKWPLQIRHRIRGICWSTRANPLGWSKRSESRENDAIARSSPSSPLFVEGLFFFFFFL